MSDVKLERQKQISLEAKARFDKASDEAIIILRDAYDKLMGRQFFFYNIASQFAIKAVHKSVCPTMGVAHQDGVHWLVYNPEFIKYYDYKEISVILEHEIHHFTFDHVKHFDSSKNAKKIFKDEEEAKNHIKDQKEQAFIHRTKNIATDRSINVHLFGLPNIRMSIEDVKLDFTDPEGNFNEEEFTSKMREQLAKGQCTFKDPNMTLDKATDDTIVEYQCITEDSFKKLLTESGYTGDVNKVKRYATWEYYFDLLMSCPKTQEAIQNIKDMDIHFGDDPGEDGEGGRDAQDAREKIIIEGAKNSNPHDIPGNLREHIRELFEKHSKEDALPWFLILRRLVNASKKSIKVNDVNSRNRYAPGKQILPGHKFNPIKDIAVIWDVSGSCMDEETQTRFIGEVNMMIKSGSNVRVYYTDQDVEHIQDCKDKMMKPSQYEITGGGGTHLDNGIKAAIKDGYKIIIQLSDNYMDFRLTKKDLKGRRIINVSTTSAKQPPHYGPQIHVNPEDRK